MSAGRSFILGGKVHVDVDRLIEGRALVQANSGGGKSHTLRRLLEQTHPFVQQIVLDVEDEFATLREKFDYALAGKGGECAADLKSAALLPRRLLELNVSAIIGLGELQKHERILFVKRFLESLIGLPRDLWRPLLVVVDEAHMFCPQTGSAESSAAVIDLMTRGRKRGFCGVLATQRLSKLHKDAAAEVNNKLIGRTGLDVDMKRAAEELGFTTRDEARALRKLKPGHFYAFGPAISDEVIELQVGDVATTHPKLGQRAIAPPPPRDKVKRILGQLADLPAEAEAEAKTSKELLAENRKLKHELAAAKAAGPAPKTVEVERLVEVAVEVPAVSPELGAQLGRYVAELQSVADQVTRALAAAPKSSGSAGAGRSGSRPGRAPSVARPTNPAEPVRSNGHRPKAGPPPYPAPKPVGGPPTPIPSRSPGVEQRVLNALAELEMVGAGDPPRVQVALLAGYAHPRSKGFINAIGALHTAGAVEYPGTGTVRLTEAGRRRAVAPERPTTAEELQERVIRLLGGGVSERVLRPVLAAYPGAIDRSELAAAAGYEHVRSKGFINAIGRLRTLGLIAYPSSGSVAAEPVLFLEA